jgi:hypothetical protein
VVFQFLSLLEADGMYFKRVSYEAVSGKILPRTENGVVPRGEVMYVKAHY